MEDEHLGYLVPNGKDGVEGSHGLLEDHGDAVPPYSAHVVHGQIEEVHSVEVNLSVHDSSRRLRYEAHDGEGCYALATPRLAYEPEGFLPVQIEAHIIDGLSNSLEGVEVRLELLNLKKVGVIAHQFSIGYDEIACPFSRGTA